MIKKFIKLVLKKTIYPLFKKGVLKVLRSDDCINILRSSSASNESRQADLSLVKLQSMATLKRIQQEMASSSVENFET